MTNKQDLQNVAGSDTKVEESTGELAEWTIMIYMAGDNNLSDDFVNALKMVQDVKTGDLIHVIAQLDPADTRIGSQRVVMNLRDKKQTTATPIRVPDSPSKLSKDYVKIEEGKVKFINPAGQKQESDSYETDTADPKTLFDFISWCKDEFKAKRRMLILAGHSGGIEEGYLLKDENPVQSMSLNGLMEVLRQVKERLDIKIDILGMDSCLMSMIEICHELWNLGDVVEVYVSSQSMTPNPGWPYAQIVEALMGNEKIETTEFARTIVKRYINSYVENAVCSGLSTDQAAVKIAATRDVVQSFGEFGRVLRSKMQEGSATTFNRALVHAHWEAQSYNGERFVDLWDFCHLAERYCEDEQVTGAVKAVEKALGSMVLASCYCGIDYQYSYGLSVYFPWSTIFSYYQNLDFAKDTGADWVRFLLDYVEKTRREPRGGDDAGPWRENTSTRKVPPYDHGPLLPATSMRNPPLKWSKKGISYCIDNRQEWSELFDEWSKLFASFH